MTSAEKPKQYISELQINYQCPQRGEVFENITAGVNHPDSPPKKFGVQDKTTGESIHFAVVPHQSNNSEFVLLQASHEGSIELDEVLYRSVVNVSEVDPVKVADLTDETSLFVKVVEFQH